MNRNRSSAEPRRAARQDTAARPAGPSLRARAGLVLGLTAMVAVAAGCGMEKRKVAAEPVEQTVVVPAVESHATLQQAAVASLGGIERQDAPAAMAEGFPPDIIVTASDTVAAPGEVIDIVVQATPDVTEMSLWDGYGDRQALHYDESAKAWRVSYRVPLRLPWERTGLAVTAKNESNRWCRSWIFVRSQAAEDQNATPQSPESASPESAMAVEK